eukprot:scaffold22742_cov139-Cylindrotheca_fusiformis.AAC.14
MPPVTNDVYVPTATAVLIDDDHTDIQAGPATSDHREQFASALVVGRGDSKVSFLSQRVIQATETTATAKALDPWSKEPTVAADDRFGEDDSSANESRPPANVANLRIPPALYEDPKHKKYRRRRRRRARMILGGAGGIVVGAILLGPIGAVVGALGTATVTRAASKARERRKDERVLLQLEENMRQLHPEAQQFWNEFQFEMLSNRPNRGGPYHVYHLAHRNA